MKRVRGERPKGETYARPLRFVQGRTSLLVHIKFTLGPRSTPTAILLNTHKQTTISFTMMKFLISLVLLAVAASAQQCQIAMGVSSANEDCSEAIISEISLYMQIAHREECGLPGARRHLEGEEEPKQQLRGSDRELQSQQQCDTWQYFCTIGYNPQYYCQAYYSCLRRDLEETPEQEPQAVQEESHARQLSEPTEDPLTDAGWESCSINFGTFLKNVDDNFLSGYATSEIRQCWKYMWCRVKK